MMGHAVCAWLMLACCAMLVATESQDHVLRFVSQKELAQKTKEKGDDIIIVSGDKSKDLPMQKFRARNTVCPDKVTQCTGDTTCCPLHNGQYGCCDGVNAVCCKDGVHCCPQGYTCDEEHGQCRSAALGISFHWVDKKVVHAHPVLRATVNITCSDKKTVCEQNDTCCNATGPVAMGCCPLSHAVCCSDKAHCCPAGTKCDTVRRRCFSAEGNWEQPWVQRRPAAQQKEHKMDTVAVTSSPVVCPGGWRECPANNSCCKMMSGEFGCCPKPNGVCCSDGIHCCPHGYVCDDAKKGCRPPQGEVFTPWEEKKPAAPRPVKSVVCPGGQFECPDGNTCCPLASGEWGCCPRPNAVCCSDKIHCCPQSYTCDQGSCKSPQGGLFVPWEEKKPASPRVSSGAVVCPDRKTQCADGQTCCQESSGEYGCCPFPEAVCCKDHTHCCPNGFTCNLEEKTCEKGQESVSWLPKQPPALRAPANIICPDGQSQCPDGQTCCKNDAGAYACCPSPNATCCSDHVHCCPQGYKCDLAAKTCSHGLSEHFPSLPMLKKEPAIVEVKKVQCPDGKSECADGQTCCKLSSGQYGCCPRPNAVCCADHLHCCPQGYTCDTGEGRCNKGLHSLPWDEKQPASRH